MQPVDIRPALTTQVLKIARHAGDAIMVVYQAMRQQGCVDGVQLADKADHSPLTQADIRAHQLISHDLVALTPQVPVVSEEDEASWSHRQPEGEFWLIDPLDGTKEFLAQSGDFTVNIALVRNGRPVLGVVVAPALGLAYWGATGLGAFRAANGRVESIQVASPSPSGQQRLRVVASKSHMNASTLEFVQRLGACELVQAGSSLKFCRIAEGSADIYPRLGPTCEWDTAAAQVIVEAAGGHVSTLEGRPLGYGKKEVLNPSFVASNEPLDRLCNGSLITRTQTCP